MPLAQAHDGKATARTGYGPGWLTSQICAARDVAELAACVQAADELNSIHVAAAIVRLAKVAQSEDSASSEDPSSSASRQQPGASSSGSDAGHVGHATNARQPARNRRRGRHAAPAGSAAGSGSSSTDGTAAGAAQALAQRLGAMYLEFSAQGLYSTARQHSNITWALSKLGFAPPAGLVQQAISQVLESGQRRLKTSNAQEVANLAYGLAQLGVVGPDVWVAIAAAAQQHLTAFKPQELSNLAWALATTHQKAQQQYVGQAERAQAERTQAERTQAERTQAERAQAERTQAERVQAQRQDSQHQGGAEVQKLAQAQQAQQVQQMQQQVQHAQQQQAQQQLAQTGERRPSLQEVCRELLHDLGRQAALDVPRFAPSDLSTLLWALAKAGVQWQPLLTATANHLTALCCPDSIDRASSNSPRSIVSGRLCPSLSEFSCQELCNVLGAYARLRHRHEGLMVAAADIFTGWAEADALPSQSIANAVWAMARLQLLPPQESAALGANALPQRQQQLTAVQEQHSAVLLRFTHAMAAAAARSTPRFNAQEISNALWGLLKLQESLGYGAASDAEHELLLSAQLLGAEVAELHSLDSAPDAALEGVQQAARVAAAGFASHEGSSQQQQQQQQQGRRPREQRQGSRWESAPAHPTGGQPGAVLQANLVRLANAARWRAGSMEPAALAQLSWACWRLAGPDADHLVLAVSGAALPRLAQFKAQELTTLVHSLARQKQVYLDARLMRAAGDAAVALLQARGGGGGGGGARAFTPAGLANLVWAFAVRGQRHDALARAIATAARQRIRHFGHQELANLLWGLYRWVPALLHHRTACICRVESAR